MGKGVQQMLRVPVAGNNLCNTSSKNGYQDLPFRASMYGTCQPGGRRHLNGRKLTHMDPNGLQKPQFYCRRRGHLRRGPDTFPRVVCHDQHWLPHRFHLEPSLPTLSHTHQPAGESHASCQVTTLAIPALPLEVEGDLAGMATNTVKVDAKVAEPMCARTTTWISGLPW